MAEDSQGADDGAHLAVAAEPPILSQVMEFPEDPFDPASINFELNAAFDSLGEPKPLAMPAAATPPSESGAMRSSNDNDASQKAIPAPDGVSGHDVASAEIPIEDAVETPNVSMATASDPPSMPPPALRSSNACEDPGE